MPKKEVNKSQAIRDALQANPSRSPSEIATALNAKGIKVNAQYVSVVKSSMKSKKGGATMRGGRKTTRGGRATNGDSHFSAAIDFIRASGGLDQAKHTLDTIEKISAAVR